MALTVLCQSWSTAKTRPSSVADKLEVGRSLLGDYIASLQRAIPDHNFQTTVTKIDSETPSCQERGVLPTVWSKDTPSNCVFLIHNPPLFLLFCNISL